MGLRTYLDIFTRRKGVIFVLILFSVIIAVMVNRFSEPVYEASASLRVAGATFDYVDYRYYDRLMNTYISIAVSEPVLDELRQLLGLAADTDLSIVVEAIPESELIEITTRAQTPLLAQSLANTLAQMLVDRNQNLYVGGSKSAEEILAEQLAQSDQELEEARENYVLLLEKPEADPDQLKMLLQEVDFKQGIYELVLERYEQARLNEVVRTNAITIVDPGELPRNPIRPNRLLNLALGILVGVIIGSGLAFVIENLDTTIHTRQEIESLTQIPVVAEIPDFDKKPILPFIRSTGNQDNAHAAIEEIKSLRSRLMHNSGDGPPPKTILVISTDRGEGKSTIAAKFAISFAQIGKTVAIVDSDLFSPEQHLIWDLPNHLGLTNVLNEEVPLEEVLQRSSIQGVRILTSGPINNQSSELLASPKMQSLADSLIVQFDLTIFDTAGRLSLSDIAPLARAMDRVLLITAHNKIRCASLEKTLRDCAELGVQPWGIVINHNHTNHKDLAQQYKRIAQLITTRYSWLRRRLNPHHLENN